MQRVESCRPQIHALAALFLAIGLALGCGPDPGNPALPSGPDPGNPALPSEPDSRYSLFVLGRAQDGGVPHLGCSRRFCQEARQKGQREFPASLGLHDRETGALVLIEATPELEAQIARLHLLAGQSQTDLPRRPVVDGILLTHAHIGHYAGLMQLGREVASTQAVPVYVTPRMAEFLSNNGPWSQLVDLSQIALNLIEPGGAAFSPMPGITVEAIPVPHRDEFSDSVCFRIHGPKKSVLFCPDVDAWDRHPGLLDSLIEGVDVAYLDGTFFDGRELASRNMAEIPHPPIVDTVSRLQSVAAAQPGRIRFIHLNHTNPALSSAELQEKLKARGFQVAQPNERVGL